MAYSTDSVLSLGTLSRFDDLPKEVMEVMDGTQWRRDNSLVWQQISARWLLEDLDGKTHVAELPQTVSGFAPDLKLMSTPDPDAWTGVREIPNPAKAESKTAKELEFKRCFSYSRRKAYYVGKLDDSNVVYWAEVSLTKSGQT